jgi:hypothetical protein
MHTKNNFLQYKTAVGLSFLIFTPVLIFVSWLLQILVDDPYKDLAYDLDIATRHKKDEKEDSTWFSTFLKHQLKVFALFMYFILLYVVTESYSTYSNKESDINYNE